MNYYQSHITIWCFTILLTLQLPLDGFFEKVGMVKPLLPKSKLEWSVIIPLATYFAYYSIIKFKRPLTSDKLPPLNNAWDYVIHAQIERDDIDSITNLPRYPAHGLGHVLSPLDKAGRIFISYIKMLYFIRELYNDSCLFLELFAPEK